jgi:hypothetical protein
VSDIWRRRGEPLLQAPPQLPQLRSRVGQAIP